MEHKEMADLQQRSFKLLTFFIGHEWTHLYVYFPKTVFSDSCKSIRSKSRSQDLPSSVI